jgi:hypothetical protein
MSNRKGRSVNTIVDFRRLYDAPRCLASLTRPVPGGSS